MTLRTSFASVTPDRPKDVPRSMPLVPFASSASVMSVWSTSTLAPRAPWERSPPEQVDPLMETSWQSSAEADPLPDRDCRFVYATHGDGSGELAQLSESSW